MSTIPYCYDDGGAEEAAILLEADCVVRSLSIVESALSSNSDRGGIYKQWISDTGITENGLYYWEYHHILMGELGGLFIVPHEWLRPASFSILFGNVVAGTESPGEDLGHLSTYWDGHLRDTWDSRRWGWGEMVYLFEPHAKRMYWDLRADWGSLGY